LPQLQEANVSLSASIGIAEWADHTEDMSRLLVRADAALYRAKAQGRNCVVASDADDTVGESSVGSSA
jgi:diguanylate cyclase (GGDEF)-like protein